tara:strand:- start:1583 stop:2128 length:546 start_codon:yes stop_codon:yes gene_type:complete
MKKFLVVLAVAFSSSLNAQLAFTSLNQSQNKLLNQFDIDYASLQTRYIVSTGQLSIISDAATNKEMKVAYDKFINWNTNRFEVIPDTNSNITGDDLLKGRLLIDDYVRIVLNSNQKILQSVQFNVTSTSIQTIEIVEIFNKTLKDRIEHLILVQDNHGYWDIFVYDDNDITLSCPMCAVGR